MSTFYFCTSSAFWHQYFPTVTFEFQTFTCKATVTPKPAGCGFEDSANAFQWECSRFFVESAICALLGHLRIALLGYWRERDCCSLWSVPSETDALSLAAKARESKAVWYHISLNNTALSVTVLPLSCCRGYKTLSLCSGVLSSLLARCGIWIIQLPEPPCTIMHTSDTFPLPAD